MLVTGSFNIFETSNYDYPLKVGIEFCVDSIGIVFNWLLDCVKTSWVWLTTGWWWFAILSISYAQDVD